LDENTTDGLGDGTVVAASATAFATSSVVCKNNEVLQPGLPVSSFFAIFSNSLYFQIAQ
jgi:hypothetical protein